MKAKSGSFRNSKIAVRRHSKIVRNFMLAGLNIYCISVFVQEGVLGDGICGTFYKREFFLVGIEMDQWE